jgi:hypothetical protein
MLTPEIALWVGGLLLLPAMIWTVSVTWLLKQSIGMIRGLKVDTERLLHMHENADEYGFGTGQVGKQGDAIAESLRQLVELFKWMAEHQTGKKPPPVTPKAIG